MGTRESSTVGELSIFTQPAAPESPHPILILIGKAAGIASRIVTQPAKMWGGANRSNQAGQELTRSALYPDASLNWPIELECRNALPDFFNTFSDDDSAVVCSNWSRSKRAD